MIVRTQYTRFVWTYGNDKIADTFTKLVWVELQHELEWRLKRCSDVIEKIGYYVYFLKDPVTGNVGKYLTVGSRNPIRYVNC